jgi:hypothetical protein
MVNQNFIGHTHSAHHKPVAGIGLEIEQSFIHNSIAKQTGILGESYPFEPFFRLNICYTHPFIDWLGCGVGLWSIPAQ